MAVLFPFQLLLCVSIACLKCRLVKWLLAQPMNVERTKGVIAKGVVVQLGCLRPGASTGVTLVEVHKYTWKLSQTISMRLPTVFHSPIQVTLNRGIFPDPPFRIPLRGTVKNNDKNSTTTTNNNNNNNNTNDDNSSIHAASSQGDGSWSRHRLLASFLAAPPITPDEQMYTYVGIYIYIYIHTLIIYIYIIYIHVDRERESYNIS